MLATKLLLRHNLLVPMKIGQVPVRFMYARDFLPSLGRRLVTPLTAAKPMTTHDCRYFAHKSISSEVDNPMDPSNQKAKQHPALVLGACAQEDCEQKSCGAQCPDIFYILAHFTHNKFVPPAETHNRYTEYVGAKDFQNLDKSQYLMVYETMQKLQEYNSSLINWMATSRFLKYHHHDVMKIISQGKGIKEVNQDIEKLKEDYKAQWQ